MTTSFLLKNEPHHNLVLTREYCALLHKKVAEGGFFWFKNDSQKYYESALPFMSKAGWRELPNGLSCANLKSKPNLRRNLQVKESLFLKRSGYARVSKIDLGIFS